MASFAVHIQMQKFGHFAVHLEHALSGIGRIVNGNDIARGLSRPYRVRK